MAHTGCAPRRIYCRHVCDGEHPMDSRATDKRAFSQGLFEGDRRRTLGCGSDCHDGRARRSTGREGGQAAHRLFYVAGGRGAHCATDGHNQFDADRRPPEFDDTWTVRPGGKTIATVGGTVAADYLTEQRLQYVNVASAEEGCDLVSN